MTSALAGRFVAGPRWAALASAVALLATACAGGSTAPADDAEIAAQIEPEVEAFLETADTHDQVRAVLVYHDGEPVLERYTGATPEDYWDTRSVTKSVMATLIGIAIEQGHIEGVDKTLGDLLPSYAADLTPETASITLREVLTHTAGYRAEDSPGEMYWESPDWIRTILAHRAADGPGDGSFAYSNQGAHLLSAILVEATGQSVLQYARENLFEPLGIPSEPALEIVLDSVDRVPDPADVTAYNEADFAWPVDPQGYHEGAGLAKLRPQDLAALGLLYLNDGRWAGEQVVPESWIQEATAAHVERTGEGFGYGYMWWTTEADGDAAFFARVAAANSSRWSPSATWWWSSRRSTTNSTRSATTTPSRRRHSHSWSTRPSRRTCHAAGEGSHRGADGRHPMIGVE